MGNDSNHVKKLAITISIVVENRFTIRLNQLKKRNILGIYWTLVITYFVN